MGVLPPRRAREQADDDALAAGHVAVDDRRWLGRALDGLNPAGGHAHPVPGAGDEPWGSVHAGTVNAPGGPRIGMFYPTIGETIMPDIMRALIALLGP